MPFTLRGDVRLYWKLDGAPDRPTVVLLNSIGSDMGLWDTTVPHLLPAFRLLRIDTRGHGASDAPDADYTLDLLADVYGEEENDRESAEKALDLLATRYDPIRASYWDFRKGLLDQPKAVA